MKPSERIKEKGVELQDSFEDPGKIPMWKMNKTFDEVCCILDEMDIEIKRLSKKRNPHATPKR